MAHVLLQINGITKTDISYINALQPEEKAIEIYCNKFAAEFLVPSYDFDRHSQGNIFDDKFILDLANRYNVSREVILRKFLDNNLIDIDYYLSKAEEWTKEYEEFKKKGSSGGDYYATQSTYLGENYVNLGFKKYYDGLCTIDQLAEYLNMKVKNVSNLEQYMIQKTSS
jgi:Zn-dependent peptidase ImmA (M78 family)